jgi:hypothetical protein
VADTFTFSNFAVSTLEDPITDFDTVLNLFVDDAWRFPTDLGGSKVPIVLADDTSEPEICYIVGWDALTGTATVERGREGTAARSWMAGTLVRHTFTAESLQAIARLNPQGEWNALESYVSGDLVLRNGISYIAVGPSTGEDPEDPGSTFWQSLYTPPGISSEIMNWQGPWDSAEAYLEGAVVHYQGRIWAAAQASTNSAPAVGSADWSDMAPWGGAHRYAPVLTATGTNNYAASFGAGYEPPAYYDGMRVRIIVGNNNTGAATLKLGSLPIIPLRPQRGQTAVADDFQTGEPIEVTYFADVPEFVASSIPGARRRLSAAETAITELKAAIIGTWPYNQGAEGTIDARLDNILGRVVTLEAQIVSHQSQITNNFNSLTATIVNNFSTTVRSVTWVSEAPASISPSEDYDGHPAYLKGLRVNASSGVNLVRRSTLYYQRGPTSTNFLTGY